MRVLYTMNVEYQDAIDVPNDASRQEIEDAVRRDVSRGVARGDVLSVTDFIDWETEEDTDRCDCGCGQ